MKNVVIDVKQYLDFLNKKKVELVKQIDLCLAPQEIKMKSAEALSKRNTEEGVMAFHSVMLNFRQEHYLKGHLTLLEELIKALEATLVPQEEVKVDGNI
jgi:hypothetical protein